MQSFEPPAQAATSIDFRTQLQAEREEAMHEEQAQSALRRQDAYERAAIQRQAELDRLAQDYTQQVQSIGKMHLDDNRWWAKKTTGDKIGTLALVFLGSVAALGNGGQNLAYNAVLKEIDNDLDAQKFDYHAGLERARGSQTAFGMAMERYGQEDAALAAARAGALDYAAAKAGQLGAQWKGTDSANAADEFRARIESERDRTMATGLRFVPESYSQPRYQMSFRGQIAPGTFTQEKAQEKFLEHGVKPSETSDLEVVKGGVAAQVNASKAAADARAKGQEHPVQMPNGEVVYAPGSDEATKLRDTIVSTNKVRELVRQAKELRESSTFRVSPEKRALLHQIQADLITQFGVQNKLGALSDGDRDLAVAGTADLFQLGNGVEARLDRMATSAQRDMTARIKTIPGAGPKSTGQMPGSFTAHGGKK